jgi:8-oxo-dGTP pyrophosphatase MutT (NUDIX family)
VIAAASDALSRIGVDDPGSVTLAPSAVLVALFEEDGEARAVLTRRSDRLRSHRGQVSLPGGRIEPGETVEAAALREAAEEVGMDPGTVRFEGWLDPVVTYGSSSLMLPVVGSLGRRPSLVANPTEVDRVFDVALSDLVADGVFHEERWTVPGRPVGGSADGSFPVWFFEVAGETVWGATARILVDLLASVLAPVGT